MGAGRPQPGAGDFLQPGARPFGDKVEGGWNLEAGQPPLAVLNQFLRAHVNAGMKHQVGGTHLAPTPVRDTHHGSLGDAGVQQQNLLDLGGGNVFTPER